MPLYAAIDVGSNTIRLLIGNCRDGKIEQVVYERRITRLAEGITQSGMLRDKRIDVSVAVLKDFSSLIKRNGVKTVGAVATSALREAVNSRVFVEKVRAEAGISIDIISGEKEAQLTLKGVLSSFPESVLNMCHSLLIMDIGGGSTEWILCKGNSPDGMGSIPIGVIKLLEKCIKTDPVSEADISVLNREILSAVKMFKNDIGNQVEKKTCFVGTAGTFSTLASIDLHLKTYSRERIHLHRISLDRLLDIRNKLIILPVEERISVEGLDPGRADLIIPGIQFTIILLENFAFDGLIVSDYGLLEGVFLKSLEEENEKDIPEACKS